MPKKIANLEEKILEAAKSLFEEKGYQEIDMRLIAKTVGIAVGTLYNYYSNKVELFDRVLEDSWKKTNEEILEIGKREMDYKDKLELIVETLYESFEKRKGLGLDLVKDMQKLKSKKKEFEHPMKRLHKFGKGTLDTLETILQAGVESGDLNFDKEFLDRLALDIFMGCTTMKKYFNGEDEKNIAYIKAKISYMIRR